MPSPTAGEAVRNRPVETGLVLLFPVPEVSLLLRTASSSRSSSSGVGPPSSGGSSLRMAASCSARSSVSRSPYSGAARTGARHGKAGSFQRLASHAA